MIYLSIYVESDVLVVVNSELELLWNRNSRGLFQCISLNLRGEGLSVPAKCSGHISETWDTFWTNMSGVGWSNKPKALVHYLVAMGSVKFGCSKQSHYDRRSVGQAVLVSGAHLGPTTNFSFSLTFSLDICGFVIL
jgi:hypothetical protein